MFRRVACRGVKLNSIVVDFASIDIVLLKYRAVQTPVFSPPAPAPAKKNSGSGKKTPAPKENFKLVCKCVKIGNFYSLKWKHHLCFSFNTLH